MHLCMGSACHQLGVYDVLPKIQSLIEKHHLQNKVALKGAFCLGNCSEGVIVEYRNKQFTHIKATNVTEKFEHEILPGILEEFKEDDEGGN